MSVYRLPGAEGDWRLTFGEILTQSLHWLSCLLNLGIQNIFHDYNCVSVSKYYFQDLNEIKQIFLQNNAQIIVSKGDINLSLERWNIILVHDFV